MLVSAQLVCSHEDCAAVYEAVGHPAEIDSLACGCGWGLQVLGWPEALPHEHRDGLTLVALTN